jgi:hypothetical protein
MGDRDPHAEYWQEAFECALDGEGLFSLVEQMTPDQRYAIGQSLRISSECQGLAFHIPENPMIGENKRLERKLKWQRELEHCDPCHGSGRIQYNAGPWDIDTGCHHCHGAGKVHPRGEREPA